MKTLQNNFTTPEQSNKLLELGVPADSADCYYHKDGSTIFIDGNPPRYFIKYKTYTEIEEWYKKKYEYCSQRYVLLPCWSAGRLIEIYNECNSLADEYKTRYGVNIIEDIIHEFETPYNFTHCIEFDFSKLEDCL